MMLVPVSGVGTLNGDLVSMGRILQGRLRTTIACVDKMSPVVSPHYIGNLAGQRMHVERTSSLLLIGSNIELYAPRRVEMNRSIKTRVKIFKAH